MKEILDAAGIEYDADASKSELEELMPVVEEVEEAPKKAGKEAVVLTSTGLYVRTYTPTDTDGAMTYTKKAEGYAKKIGGSVK